MILHDGLLVPNKESTWLDLRVSWMTPHHYTPKRDLALKGKNKAKRGKL